MSSRKRSKRATVEDLYKSCRLGGDCLPDVVNKVEGKTLADILLQAFGSIIFLGSLGIGTGKGSTGIVGSRAIPETIAPSRPIPSGGGRTTRPFSVPLDTIGAGRPTRPVTVGADPVGVGRPIDPANAGRPVDVIDPSSPAIITLSETTPDTIITTGEPGIRTGDTINVPEIDTVTDITSIQSHPTVIQETDSSVAILNVTPSQPPPNRVLFQSPSVTDYTVTIESSSGHLNPDINVFVDPLSFAENIVFGEEIPLEPINPRAEFEIEEPYPTTSTPVERFQNVISRARQFYGRHVQQVATRNVDFLGNVSRAVQFEFENPAFDPEVSIEFIQDVNEVAAAPDPDFADIRRLGRPTFSTTPGRTVRLSRVGSRAGVTTRKGTLLTQDVHFYYDVSNISHAEEIELPVIGESSGSSSAVNPNTESTIVDELSANNTFYPDDDLIDFYSENFDDVHLLINATDEQGDRFEVPTIPPGSTFKVFVHDIGNDIFVTAPNTNNGEPFVVPNVPYVPIQPPTGVNVYSDDFFLHPSLLPKRKRKRIEYF